jgi:hypothetical protein
MNTKKTLMVLIAAVVLVSLGCRKSGTAKAPSAPAPGQGGTASTQPPTTVGGQQAPATGTAQQPPATRPPAAAGEANEATARATQGAGATPVSADVSTQAFVKGADQTIIGLQQKMSDLQVQIGTLKPEAQQKAQQLQQRFQQDLTTARSNLDKVKTATGPSLTESKTATQKALSDATATLKELQSYVESQRMPSVK